MKRSPGATHDQPVHAVPRAVRHRRAGLLRTAIPFASCWHSEAWRHGRSAEGWRIGRCRGPAPLPLSLGARRLRSPTFNRFGHSTTSSAGGLCAFGGGETADVYCTLCSFDGGCGAGFNDAPSLYCTAEPCRTAHLEGMALSLTLPNLLPIYHPTYLSPVCHLSAIYLSPLPRGCDRAGWL